MSYYSIENILKPNFGRKSKKESDEFVKENFEQKLSSVPSPCPSTTDSPLKNSIIFLENFFKTNYKFANVSIENSNKNLCNTKEKATSIGLPQPESNTNKNRKKGTFNSSSTLPSKSLILPPNPIPAWIFCTRYSDRPSSGTRIKRKSKKTLKLNNKPSTTALVHPISKLLDKPVIKASKNHNFKGFFYKSDAQYNSTDENSVESNNCKSMDDYAGDPNKRPRTAFSHSQLHRLRKEFSANPYLTESRRRDLADTLGLKESQIKIWFQNKRAKLKKKKTGTNQTVMLDVNNPLERDSPKVRDDSHYNFTDAEEIPMEDPLLNERNHHKKERDNLFKCRSPLESIQESFADKLTPHTPSHLSLTPPISPKTQSPSSIQLASPCSFRQDDASSPVVQPMENFSFTKFPLVRGLDPSFVDSFNPYLMSQALQRYSSFNVRPNENFYYFMPFVPPNFLQSTINRNGLK